MAVFSNVLQQENNKHRCVGSTRSYQEQPAHTVLRCQQLLFKRIYFHQSNFSTQNRWLRCVHLYNHNSDNFHNHSLKYYQVLQYFSNMIQILYLKLSHTCVKLILSFRNRTESKVFNYYQLKLFPWHQTVVIQRRKLPINFKLETAGWVVCWLHSGGGAPLSLCTRVAEPGETVRLAWTSSHHRTQLTTQSNIKHLPTTYHHQQSWSRACSAPAECWVSPGVPDHHLSAPWSLSLCQSPVLSVRSVLSVKLSSEWSVSICDYQPTHLSTKLIFK